MTGTEAITAGEDWYRPGVATVASARVWWSRWRGNHAPECVGSDRSRSSGIPGSYGRGGAGGGRWLRDDVFMSQTSHASMCAAPAQVGYRASVAAVQQLSVG